MMFSLYTRQTVTVLSDFNTDAPFLITWEYGGIIFKIYYATLCLFFGILILIFLFPITQLPNLLKQPVILGGWP